MLVWRCIEDNIVCAVIDQEVPPFGAGYHGHTQFLREFQAHVSDAGA